MPELRFYTDEHIPTAVVIGLRQRGIDVVSTPEAGHLSASDEAQFKYACEHDRIVVTQDDDFLSLVSTNRDHPGIAFAQPGLDIGSMVRSLSLLAQTCTAEEMCGRVEYLR